ncbi:MAG TPA: CHAD domain-containing protein [Acetobacteraceae bacterium]|jgi:triphosphatase|nr:CHAD domain-containing protein [Acetobacteraceae bacterium]
MLQEQSARSPEAVAERNPVRSPSDAKEEVELKLLAPAGVLDKLCEAPMIVRYGRGAGAARRLEATYYDTDDRALFCHGLSLRVRRTGKTYIQTLKRGPADGQPFARAEWECRVNGADPDLALLPVSEIGAPLDGIAPNALAPIFTTTVRRRTQRLDFGGTIVEMAFDEGSIAAGDRSEPLSELELEVKAGDKRVLYDLGLELLEIAPLRLGTRSKADRGYDLAFGMAPAGTKATPPAITAEHTVDDSVGLLLANCQHHLLANQAVAEAGQHPEGVHQMRVALRRMRSACGLLHRELGLPSLSGFNAEAKWLAQLLGAARDWDVFVTETMAAPAEAVGTDLFDFDGLREAAEPHRRAAYAALREALASQRYNRFQLSLRQWIETRRWRNELENRSLAVLLEPAPAFAGRALTRLHHKVLKRGERFRHLEPAARHRVRVELKKLRYVIEFFRVALGENAKAKNYVGHLAQLQEDLGHDNDASVAWPFLCALARDSATPDVQRSIGVVMGWQARGRLAAGRLHKSWQQFKTMPTFWSD